MRTGTDTRRSSLRDFGARLERGAVFDRKLTGSPKSIAGYHAAVLRFDDPLPELPRRVLVAGVSGSGKTTVAARLGRILGLRHVEIDALFHGPGWQPRAEFLDDVRAFAAEERWVTEWQYTSKGTNEILPPRAQLAVWLDYPWRVSRARLVRRTLKRSILRQKLWNGNVEPTPWRLLTNRDPEANIFHWQRETFPR